MKLANELNELEKESQRERERERGGFQVFCSLVTALIKPWQ